MKKITLFIVMIALLMCGCAPSVSADNSNEPAAVSNPAPSATPKPIAPEVLELLEENDEIWLEKHLRYYMVGRLIIPEADINVALFIHGPGSTAAEVRQNVCDALDSAIEKYRLRFARKGSADSGK